MCSWHIQEGQFVLLFAICWSKCSISNLRYFSQNYQYRYVSLRFYIYTRGTQSIYQVHKVQPSQQTGIYTLHAYTQTHYSINILQPYRKEQTDEHAPFLSPPRKFRWGTIKRGTLLQVLFQQYCVYGPFPMGPLNKKYLTISNMYIHKQVNMPMSLYYINKAMKS